MATSRHPNGFPARYCLQMNLESTIKIRCSFIVILLSHHVCYPSSLSKYVTFCFFFYFLYLHIFLLFNFLISHSFLACFPLSLKNKFKKEQFIYHIKVKHSARFGTFTTLWNHHHEFLSFQPIGRSPVPCSSHSLFLLNPLSWQSLSYYDAVLLHSWRT